MSQEAESELSELKRCQYSVKTQTRWKTVLVKFSKQIFKNLNHLTRTAYVQEKVDKTFAKQTLGPRRDIHWLNGSGLSETPAILRMAYNRGCLTYKARS